MDDWIVQHAREHLWQNPAADGQFITKPVRLTPPSAATHSISVANTYLRLPFADWGHVYQIGSVHPSLGNLNIAVGSWVRATTLVNTYRTSILVYGESGLTMPLHHTYFTKTPNGTIVMALPSLELYSWIEKEPVFLRIYRGTDPDLEPEALPIVAVEHAQVSSEPHKATLVSRYEELKSVSHVTAYVNGVGVVDLKQDDLAVWNDVEFHIDGRVREIHTFDVEELRTYLSDLDGERKYLLHLGGNSRYAFSDDVEIFVTHRNVALYYHQHRSMSVRQLTHGDLAIPSKRINEYLETITATVDIDDLFIMVLVRDDVMARPLIYTSDRTHELYKLDDDKIIQAMVGANANVPEWRAANLEKSAVNRLTMKPWDGVTKELATEAYGYNAASRYAADTPIKVVSNERGLVAKLPPLLTKNTQVYEYDADGVLIGNYYHAEGPEYVARQSNCAMIEAIVGKGGPTLSVDYNAQDGVLSADHSYGFYLRMLKSGVPTDEFLPAVEGTDYTIDGDNRVRWTIDRTRRHGVVIDDSKHLYDTITVQDTYGVLRISIKDTVDGVRIPSFIQMESVDVWLNGHPLVYGIDYHIKWPEVVICAKRYVLPGTNKAQIRARGVTAELRKPKTGFVQYGLLLDNNQFDVKDDKVVRIIAGGKAIHREDLSYRDDTGIGVNYVDDGLPYSVDDPTIPLRDYIATATITERDKSRDLDRRVEDYLTANLPEPAIWPSAVQHETDRASPDSFFAKLLAPRPDWGAGDGSFVIKNELMLNGTDFRCSVATNGPFDIYIDGEKMASGMGTGRPVSNTIKVTPGKRTVAIVAHEANDINYILFFLHDIWDGGRNVHFSYTTWACAVVDEDNPVEKLAAKGWPSLTNVSSNIPIALENYYHVFSPTLNQLIYDFVEGRVDVTVDDETLRISDAQIDELMVRYNDLLDFDPAFVGHDQRFVKVHPHSSYEVITLTELQYSVVERISHRYLNSIVQLNKYLKVGSQ